MKINKEKVEKLAKLAHLSFEENEAKNMVNDLKKILKFINKLDEINTENITPLTHIHNKTNSIREDKTIQLDIKNAVLKNAPNHNSDYIKAPKVLRNK
jgi:aspartyl-tRNA(Asn)/glutamyl-tRNA(Gln) amidotransferase subunit C